MIFNEFQTPLESDLVKSLDKEIYSELIDIITNVQFVQNLISINRPRLSNLKKNLDGKITVNITNPHILENMDYFRGPAIHFEKYNKYTNITPNGNPKSEYAKFWKEELKKWKEGVTRPDGEWIPGNYYFYLNYNPIWIVIEKEDAKTGQKVEADRIHAFPRVWLGDYLFFHYLDQAKSEGQHGKLLKTRGVGFSFKLGSLSPCNMYVYPGQPNFHIASDKSFLEGDKGVFGKVIDTLDWIAEHTPLPKLRVIDRALEKQLGYKNEYGTVKGIKSSAHGISVKDNPDKARGVRGKLIHYEEDGKLPELEKAWGVNRKAVEQGNRVFGQMVSGGTGGTEGADFEGSEKLFYNPRAYNIYGVPNVYDKNADGTTKCGFFWGAYLNLDGCYEEVNGEPDVIKALVQILIDRYEVKRNSSDPRALTQKKAEECITPQDAIMRVDGTLFPVADLKDYLADISINIPKFISGHYIGRLGIGSDGKIKWEMDETYPVIRDFPIKDNLNKHGCVEIYEQPRRLGSGIIPTFRYIAGIDPFDDDHSTTNSLASIFIFDRFTDRIVAEYTGRPNTADEFYEIALRLLKYYNAIANYENDKKGLFGYFSNHNALHYLADNPEILKDMDMQKGTNYGNKAKGTNSGKRINEWGRRLQADWLITKAYGYDDEEENEENNLLNLHRIRSIGYLKELIGWNPDGNFDRVSAMGMLMILRADLEKHEKRAYEKKSSSVANDPYFKRFDSKYSKYI